jgi:hypothetical protein
VGEEPGSGVDVAPAPALATSGAEEAFSGGGELPYGLARTTAVAAHTPPDAGDEAMLLQAVQYPERKPGRCGLGGESRLPARTCADWELEALDEAGIEQAELFEVFENPQVAVGQVQQEFPDLVRRARCHATPPCRLQEVVGGWSVWWPRAPLE